MLGGAWGGEAAIGESGKSRQSSEGPSRQRDTRKEGRLREGRFHQPTSILLLSIYVIYCLSLSLHCVATLCECGQQ